MPEYKDDPFGDNESIHSLNSEFGGFDVPIIRSSGVKKALTLANEKLCHSTRGKNHVSRFGYDDNIWQYHYAFMMKVVIVREPENVSEAPMDPLS